MPSFGHFWSTFIASFPLFMQGLLLTLELTSASIIVGIVLGLLFCFFKLSPYRALSWSADAYIYLVRGTPLVVQIFVLYFGLTEIVKFSSFAAATLALGFHNGAYIAEIFRGSIQSIDRGQYEAGRSLGMSLGLTYQRIILPQALRRALPGLGNQFIIGLKDSSLAAFISMNELFNIATTQGSNHFDQMTYLLIVTLYYLVLVLFMSTLINRLEKRMAKSEAL